MLEVDEENAPALPGPEADRAEPVVGDRRRSTASATCIQGVVRNLTDFGAFVEVEEGIDGLVHISDMSWNRRVKHPSEVLKKGEEVEAKILKIDTENQRLSLSIKDLMPDDWQEFSRRYRVGDILEGKIVRLADFGAFVELSEGVEGLVHISEMAHERLEKPGDKFQPGQSVRVKILRVDPEERKIGLSVKAAQDELGSGDLKQYQNARQEEAARSSITLGDVAGDLSALRERAAQRQADGEPGGDKGSEG